MTDQWILSTVIQGRYGLKKIKIKIHAAGTQIMQEVTHKNHKTAKWIRRKTGIADIQETRAKLNCNWAGYVARRKDNH